MKSAGLITLGLGVLLLLVALNTDTTVYSAGMRIHNIGLMDERKNHLIVAGLAILVGAIFYAMDILMDRRSKDALSSGANRKCPFCAELVKVEAVLCKHCGKDIPSQSVEIKSEEMQRAAEKAESTGTTADEEAALVIPEEMRATIDNAAAARMTAGETANLLILCIMGLVCVLLGLACVLLAVEGGAFLMFGLAPVFFVSAVLYNRNTQERHKRKIISEAKLKAQQEGYAAGTPHHRHPNVVWDGTGQLLPADGYTWAGGPNDYLVKLKDPQSPEVGNEVTVGVESVAPANSK